MIGRVCVKIFNCIGIHLCYRYLVLEMELILNTSPAQQNALYESIAIEVLLSLMCVLLSVIEFVVGVHSYPKII